MAYVALRWTQKDGQDPVEEILHTTSDFSTALGAADSFRPERGLCRWEQVNETRWRLLAGGVPTGLWVVKR